MARDRGKWETLDPDVLGSAFGRLDPMPPGLPEQLKKSLRLRRNDAELAQVTIDEPSVGPVGRSSSDRGQTIVFESKHCTVTATWTASPDRPERLVDLDGVIGRATPVVVVVDTPKRTIEGVVDGEGIRAEGVSRGPVRLRLIVNDDDEPWLVETEWITL